MKYEFKDQNEEEKLNLISFNKAIAQNQIGTFDVYTGNRKLLSDGKGTLFIYFQGIEIKCGIDDRVGNSAISWIEESLFPAFPEVQDKTAKLPIEHLAKKIGFDHFITFNFPEELTANGFAISMNNLLSYLEQNNFVTVLSAFSTGATLMAEWLLSAINNKDFKNLSIFSEKITRVIMAGGLFEPKDLERKAYLAGKYLIKFPERIIKRLPLINRNPFIKRAGGAKEMFYRVKYLFSIRNKEIIEKMSEQEWINAGEIFKKNQDFQLIFLADTGQRIVLPSGAGKWYQVMYKNLGSQVKGLVAKNVEKGWIDYPVSKHEEVKNLWTLLSLIGTSPNLRKDLNFSLMSTQIADEWPKYRFIHMARGPI